MKAPLLPLVLKPLSLAEAATWSPQQVVALAERCVAAEREVVQLRQEVAALKQELAWFKRQLFGKKSERRVIEGESRQLGFDKLFDAAPALPPATEALAPPTSPGAGRPRRQRAADDDGPTTFFNEDQVPIEVIRLEAPEVAGLSPDQYEVVGEKISHRLAQRPGSYVVLKYVRTVVKLRDRRTLVCAPAPAGVLEGSRADVSLLAGLLVDKIQFHLPFYRLHQRLTAAGFRVSRPWLTQLAQQAIALLEPIYDAQFAAILTSRVKTMDETPIKAGVGEPGHLKTAYFWPVYGEDDEICFAFQPSRGGQHVAAILGPTPVADGVLLTDGYAPYARYAQETGITHAQCWAHTRRQFFDTQAADPVLVADALEQIGQLYEIEADGRAQSLSRAARQAHRLTHSRPRVERFFDWVAHHLAAPHRLPKDPLTKALTYANERRRELSVFLTDPDVPLDTNHLERALRPIPMGRRAWLFAWTELGAQQIGIIQSLVTTCRLHGIDPYTYLVDVLQRVSCHPASQIALLTPRLWKLHFANNPLRSDLHLATQPRQ